jgi:hypothetical protein
MTSGRRASRHEWTTDKDYGWSCRCGTVCDHGEPCGRHGACKAAGRTLSGVIADAVNERYGYDLFSDSVGDAVLAALAEAGYEIEPRPSSANDSGAGA